MRAEIDVLSQGRPFSMQARRNGEQIQTLGVSSHDIESDSLQKRYVVPLHIISPESLRRAADLLEKSEDLETCWGLPEPDKRVIFAIHPERSEFGLAVVKQ